MNGRSRDRQSGTLNVQDGSTPDNSRIFCSISRQLNDRFLPRDVARGVRKSLNPALRVSLTLAGADVRLDEEAGPPTSDPENAV